MFDDHIALAYRLMLNRTYSPPRTDPDPILDALPSGVYDKALKFLRKQKYAKVHKGVITLTDKGTIQAVKLRVQLECLADGIDPNDTHAHIMRTIRRITG